MKGSEITGGERRMLRTYDSILRFEHFKYERGKQIWVRDEFSKGRFSQEEIEGVLRVVSEKDNVVLMPLLGKTTGTGLTRYEIFRVLEEGPNSAKVELLIRFDDSQIPDKFSLKYMAQWYGLEKSVGLASRMGRPLGPYAPGVGEEDTNFE